MIIRYSMLDEYTRCPASCKRKYIDGIKDPDTSATYYGRALHLAIKTHFEGDDGLETFKMYWNSIKHLDIKYYRHDWDELNNLAVNTFLPNFFRLHASKYSNPIMEEQCEMPLFDDHLLQGTFDMVSDYEGVLTVSDWKTSTGLYKREKIHKNPQLWLYTALYRHKYGVLPKQIAYKVFVKSESRIQTFTTDVTEEKLALQLDNCYAIIRSLLHSIETNNFYHSFECYCEGLK